MPTTWIEKNPSQRVKEWAFGKLNSGDILFAADREKQGYPTVAEISVTPADKKRFRSHLDNALSIIMFAPGQGPIDDPDENYSIDEITFHVECVG